MGISDGTLHGPARGRADADDRDTDEPRLDLRSAVLRFVFTVAALVGLSALFASQIRATLQ